MMWIEVAFLVVGLLQPNLIIKEFCKERGGREGKADSRIQKIYRNRLWSELHKLYYERVLSLSRSFSLPVSAGNRSSQHTTTGAEL